MLWMKSIVLRSVSSSLTASMYGTAAAPVNDEWGAAKRVGEAVARDAPPTFKAPVAPKTRGDG
jgi:hypothetical protein